MTTLLAADRVSKQYSHHRALHQVSLEVPGQSIFGLLGPNGAGKTTLIRIINQIMGPDEGQILFRGEKIRARDVRHIGYLPEERGLYKKMKLGEQAIYLARLKGLSRYEARKELKRWFEKFDLAPWWDKKAEELSKGMQQKLQFIITILHRPQLLIFDEPFSGFDPINVNLLKEEILQLRREGATIIFSTHNMASVEELCDHIALINRSEKILEGPVGQVKKAFSGRIYEVEMDGDIRLDPGDFSEEFRLLTHKQKNGSARLRFQLGHSVSTNDLMTKLLAAGKLVSFRELTPSMNDIFIKKVSGHFPAEGFDDHAADQAAAYREHLPGDSVKSGGGHSHAQAGKDKDL